MWYSAREQSLILLRFVSFQFAVFAYVEQVFIKSDEDFYVFLTNKVHSGARCRTLLHAQDKNFDFSIFILQVKHVSRILVPLINLESLVSSKDWWELLEK